MSELVNEIMANLKGPDAYWVAFGFLGQLIFMARFIVQWIASERQKRVVIPVQFWFLSITGSLILLIYSIKERNPVFIFGQLTGTFIYARNLVLYSREKKQNALLAKNVD